MRNKTKASYFWWFLIKLKIKRAFSKSYRNRTDIKLKRTMNALDKLQNRILTSSN